MSIGFNAPSRRDLLAAIQAEPVAFTLFNKLNANNRFALAFRTQQARTPATRSKRVSAFVEMLKRGETPYPNGKGAKEG